MDRIHVCSFVFFTPFRAHAATDAPSDVQHLTGEWAFYWQQLLTPADFARSDRATGMSAGSSEKNSPQMIAVGKSWNLQQVDGGKLPLFGYGTYRTHWYGFAL